MASMGKTNIHVIFLLIVIVIASSLVLAYPSLKDGMSNMDSNSAPIRWTMGQSSWTGKADNYAKNMDSSSKYKGNAVDDDQMFFFENNKFKPECCPSTYSTGSGCACISDDQINYLNQRGGNRTLAPAEY
jgi:hypothetical protein